MKSHLAASRTTIDTVVATPAVPLTAVTEADVATADGDAAVATIVKGDALMLVATSE
jgi:hypothetical protein